MRIVMFIGSPITVDKTEVEKLAKRLKKEKVNVDIVSYGEHQKNNELLTAFINTLNGKDGTGSHLVSVPRGSQLQEALISSAIIQGEDGMGAGGAGFEFGVDPNEDPELALALRVSMEEQRQRQEEEQRRAQAASAQDSDMTVPAISTATPTSDEAMLERALALSTETPVKRHRVRFA
jgi:26S proteasome regulatory subunit N10